jgi:shikimate dehydrogenase
MKAYGLIGKSLKHSFSQAYFEKKFQSLGIEASYANFEIDDIQHVRDLIGKEPLIAGLNVTIPYKQTILPYLDEIDADAKAIGAVNTIRIRDGKWKGFNTDYYGFMTSLKPFLENVHNRALILGSGGASLAIQYGLRLLDIPFHVVSRETAKGDLTYKDLNENVVKACKLIVNTSPVGMYPDVNRFPDIPYEFISADHLAYDLVYNPEESQFLRLAKEHGALTMNGLDMLKHQAEKAWRIWNF